MATRTQNSEAILREICRNYGGYIKIVRRDGFINASAEDGKYAAYLTIFGHDCAAHGNNRSEAARNAVAQMPHYLQRHFDRVNFPIAN